MSRSDGRELKRWQWTPLRVGALVGVATIVVLAALSGYMEYRTRLQHAAEIERSSFVEVAKQVSTAAEN